jgi:hypothetical protein
MNPSPWRKLSRYDQLLVDRATFDVHDPRGFNGGDKPIKFPLREICALTAGWIGVNGEPVKVGDRLKLPLDDAQTAVNLGRAEFT